MNGWQNSLVTKCHWRLSEGVWVPNRWRVPYTTWKTDVHSFHGFPHVSLQHMSSRGWDGGCPARYGESHSWLSRGGTGFFLGHLASILVVYCFFFFFAILYYSELNVTAMRRAKRLKSICDLYSVTRSIDEWKRRQWESMRLSRTEKKLVPVGQLASQHALHHAACWMLHLQVCHLVNFVTRSVCNSNWTQFWQPRWKRCTVHIISRDDASCRKPRCSTVQVVGRSVYWWKSGCKVVFGRRGYGTR